MKILEITEFSAGIDGVWTRVLSESKELIKLGHDVMVFSSDLEKGTNKVVNNKDEIEGVKIKRFKSYGNPFTENVRFWFYKTGKEELMEYNPNIIVTHLMHPHSANISSLIDKLKKNNPKIKIFIVPHAPFNVKRRFPLNILTKIWRKFSTLDLGKFDGVIAITQWEKPYLKKLNAKNIIYIPNGIPKEFFTTKLKEGKDILFFGRIAPVKNIETFVKAAKLLENSNIKFVIQGPSEEAYLNKLKKLIKGLNIKNIEFKNKVYNLKDKINAYDDCKIFVLPSKREAMPQVLIEAMARGKIVISSKTDGGKEIIEDEKTGFLFDIGNEKQLAELVNRCLKNRFKNIGGNARKEAEKYKWSVLIKKIENAYSLG